VGEFNKDKLQATTLFLHITLDAYAFSEVAPSGFEICFVM
jgi:hypothetical protein